MAIKHVKKSRRRSVKKVLIEQHNKAYEARKAGFKVADNIKDHTTIELMRLHLKKQGILK